MNRFLARLERGRIVPDQTAEHHHGCLVWWRGYVANRTHVLRAAEEQGLVPLGRTDGELFALAYRLWGAALQAEATGEYAVAVCDERTNAWLATHDAFGLLPLFYHECRTSVVCASHLEDLVRAAGVGDLDEEYLADFLATGSYLAGRTPYTHLHRLPAGHSLVCEHGSLCVRRTWQLTAKPLSPAADRTCEEEFLAVLTAGVAAAIEQPANVWTELSGGLDSSTVAAIAARCGKPSLQAISLVYERYAAAGETQWIESAARHCGIPRHAVPGDDLLPFSALPDRFCAEPGAVMVDWNWRRRFEEVVLRHGAAVVLTGQGGDLVMFAHATEPFYLADLARTGRWRMLGREITRWQLADRQHRPHLHWWRNYVFKPLCARLAGRALQPAWLRGTSSLLRASYAKRMALAGRGPHLTTGRGRSVEEYWFAAHLLGFCSRMSHLNQMPLGFAFRHPLLYRPLVEFMLNLPPARKYQPAMERDLQRRALRGILPEDVRTRRDKTIFDQPYYEGLRLGRAWTELLTENPRVVQRGIVEESRWLEAVARARHGRTERLREFEAIAVLEIWLRQFEQPDLTFAPADHARTPAVSVPDRIVKKPV